VVHPNLPPEQLTRQQAGRRISGHNFQELDGSAISKENRNSSERYFGPWSARTQEIARRDVG